MKRILCVLAGLLSCHTTVVRTGPDPEWISLFNGKNLAGWTSRGQTTWQVRDGVLTGVGGVGHIYADPELRDLEVRGLFRVSDQGNSGLYFRAHPAKKNPNGFPAGYEAQIDNHSHAHTGWLWKPGTPTGPARQLLTQDNEWFSLRVKAIGQNIQIWVNEQLVTEHQDKDFKKGRFAIQGHNPGMTIEAKELFYRDWSGR